MDIFIIEHAPSGDIARSYGGIAQDVAEREQQKLGNPYDIVDEATYNAKVAAVEEARNKAHPVL